jgi:dsRNA-specific ribonuclease
MRNESNYEVYEFLGDAVLKLLGSIEVFVEYPLSMEGDLHLRRARIVSNENLRCISVRKKLFYYIMSFKFDYLPEEFL